MSVITEIPSSWTRDHTAVLASVVTIIGLFLFLFLFVEYPFERARPWRLDMLLASIAGYIVLKIVLITRDSSTESEVVE